uniref:Transposase n=1 Tax=Mesocestoides corti TaxID=53468 RepID=A0A5K3FVY3_MESCO
MPERLCPRLAFDSTSLAHYRKKKKSHLSLPLCSLIDGWHSCQHAVVVANTFLLPFAIIVDCVCDTAIAFCLQNRIADLANLHAFKSHFKRCLSLASRRIWTDQTHFGIVALT